MTPPSVPVESREQPSDEESMWQIVRIPSRKREIWGDWLFEAIAEAVKRVTQGRRDFDPEVYCEPVIPQTRTRLLRAALADRDATIDQLRAERDRARDLAAHALAIEPLDDETDFAAGYNEARSDFRAVLAAHLEADAAKLREEPRR